MVNFNALNSGNLVKGAAALGVSVMIGSALRGRFAPKPVSALARIQSDIVSAGKAVAGAPSAAFKGLKNLISPPAQPPSRREQVCKAGVLFAAMVTTGFILQGARK